MPGVYRSVLASVLRVCCLTFTCPNIFLVSQLKMCVRVLGLDLTPGVFIGRPSMVDLQDKSLTVCSVSSVGGHPAQGSVSELGGQYAQDCPWLTVFLPSSLKRHKEKVINQTCFLLLVFAADEEGEGACSVMNILTSSRFQSTVYPWGMEQLVHGLRGNCLFLWPAAKGEEVNGKRYESVGPLRWWIRCKLEEEVFQSWALWLLPFLTALNCFLPFLPQPIPVPHFFPHSFLPFSPIFSNSNHPMRHRGCVGWQVGLGEVQRARATFADCETESWDSMAFSENTVCSRNHKAVQSHGEPWPWAVQEKNQHKSIESEHEHTGRGAPCMCALIGIWCFAENGLDRAPHELLQKPRMSLHHQKINKLMGFFHIRLYLSCTIAVLHM